ncbi:hypothetical protein ASH00_01785 [Arthrobacter sp. Soil782]|uniref:hypothetical protein n=1 Tax=Arthrobacter sp. Soil782 TaxID=1736410 RepID=UPI0006FE880B|nr:hypothetical protein [Arthrobacter sp. Soil782]KRF08478.1 hypothetical protein ASH00_01785 [Arthrobacter sp. Soil782]
MNRIHIHCVIASGAPAIQARVIEKAATRTGKLTTAWIKSFQDWRSVMGTRRARSLELLEPPLVVDRRQRSAVPLAELALC